MAEERKRAVIDRFAIVNDYDTLPLRKFLHILAQLTPIKAIKGFVNFIKGILYEARSYAAYHFISHAKGILPFPSAKDGVDPNYYNYRETDRCAHALDKIWETLDIDLEVYRNPETRARHEKLVEALTSLGYDYKTVRCAEYNPTLGMFVLPDVEGQFPFGKEFMFFSQEQYEQFLEFAGQKGIDAKQGYCSVAELGSGNIIVRTNEVVHEYMQSLVFQEKQVDIPEEAVSQENVEPEAKPAEKSAKESEKAPAKEKEDQKEQEAPEEKEQTKEPVKEKKKEQKRGRSRKADEKPRIKINEEGKWEKIQVYDKEAQKAVKSKVLSLSEEQRGNAKIRLTFTPKFFIPERDQNGKKALRLENWTINGQKDITILVPEKCVREIPARWLCDSWGNQKTISLTLPAYGKLKCLDKDGKPMDDVEIIELMKTCTVTGVLIDKPEVEDVSRWLDSLVETRDSLAEQGMTKTAAAVDKYLEESHLKKVDGKWKVEKEKDGKTTYGDLPALSEDYRKQIHDRLNAVAKEEHNEKTKEKVSVADDRYSVEKTTVQGRAQFDRLLSDSSFEQADVENGGKTYLVARIMEGEARAFTVITKDEQGNAVPKVCYDIVDVEKAIGGITDEPMSVVAVFSPDQPVKEVAYTARPEAQVNEETMRLAEKMDQFAALASAYPTADPSQQTEIEREITELKNQAKAEIEPELEQKKGMDR